MWTAGVQEGWMWMFFSWLMPTSILRVVDIFSNQHTPTHIPVDHFTFRITRLKPTHAQDPNSNLVQHQPTRRTNPHGSTAHLHIDDNPKKAISPLRCWGFTRVKRLSTHTHVYRQVFYCVVLCYAPITLWCMSSYLVFQKMCTTWFHLAVVIHQCCIQYDMIWCMHTPTL